jgi:cyclic pyranopterin monophosphate synthase
MTQPPPKLSHVDKSGAAHMVDVGAKNITQRVASAAGMIAMSAAARDAITNHTLKKGDVLAVARVAGIMAAKQTSALIPLCHPLAITSASIDFVWQDDGLECTATVCVSGQTGVEMESLTAVSISLLTIYDMAKSLDKNMKISDIRLISKTGGKSGDWAKEA